MKNFSQYILEEMPQYYPGDVTYQKDSKFTPISMRNISDYIVLGELDEFVYVVHPDQTMGFVFNISDLQKKENTVIPVMRVSLRDTPLGYKQAHFLRIREAFSKSNVTSTWYNLYIDKFGGIVSDNEHLEGGKRLWRSFIKKATADPTYKISKVDLNTMEYSDFITTNTPESEIWSVDASKKGTVLVYEKL
jgi:hypothetical protein